jgi:hypothetical protein
MPYNSQGIVTTEGSKRIELSYFIKKNLFKKHSFSSGVMSWNCRGENTGSISYETVFNDTDKYIRLKYTITDNQGIKTNYDYKINLIPVKSNLGIGNVYYFECPVSYQKCRVLYLAYSSHYFKCRSAYQHRIYYEIQRVSKQFYYLQRYFDIEKQLDKIYYGKKYFKETYRGQETRAYKRIQALSNKLKYYNDEGVKALDYTFRKLKKY